MPLSTAARRVAERSHGIITRQQLLALDCGPAMIDHHVRRGQLVTIRPGIYRIGGAPLTRNQDVLGACLDAGPLALVSHRSAGALWGLDRISVNGVDILTPRWKRTRADAKVRRHEAVDLRAVDVASCHGIPVTSPVRTCLDLAACVSSPALEAAIDSALRRDLVAEDVLERRFLDTARRGKRGYAKLRLVIEGLVGRTLDTDSRFEDLVIDLIQRAGLPVPVAQHPVDLGHTEVRLDLSWPDLKLAVECDSLAHHRDVHAFRWDRRRQNDLVLLGWQILRFTWDDVITHPERTIRTLRYAYEQRSRLGPPAH